MQTPTVSVIITAKNEEKHLAECLSSVLVSKHEELDVVIVNDGSTDRSGDILDEFAANDPRIRVIHRTSMGRRSSLVAAHNAAVGELQCWVDADDRIHPDAIGACVTKIDQDHQLVYTYRNLINTEGVVVGPHAKNRIEYRPLQVLVDNMIFHLRMFTTDLFVASGGVGELESAIDWDMNLRMTELTTPRCVPRCLYDYRIHDDRMSRTVTQETAAKAAVEAAIKRRRLDVDLVVSDNGWGLRKRKPSPRRLELP